MLCKVWDKITYPFPNFTIEIWEWINNFIPQFIMDLDKGMDWDKGMDKELHPHKPMGCNYLSIT